MLIVRGVTAHYDGAIVALEDVDMTVSKGGIVALLGPNGAGKTTLLKAIAGMLPFEQGDVVHHETKRHRIAPQSSVPWVKKCLRMRCTSSVKTGSAMASSERRRGNGTS